jgi:hypothetical protein
MFLLSLVVEGGRTLIPPSWGCAPGATVPVGGGMLAMRDLEPP